MLVRVRPLGPRDDAGGNVNGTCGLVTTDTTITTHGRVPEMFTFDVVADANTTQERIFRTVGKDVSDSCLQGYNGTIIC